MEVRAFNCVVMPAFAMDTVCCSITSWIAVLNGPSPIVRLDQSLILDDKWHGKMYRSASSILSNSSMQQTPMSARTRAPPSRCRIKSSSINVPSPQVLWKDFTENKLIGRRIFHYSGSQTHTRRTLACDHESINKKYVDPWCRKILKHTPEVYTALGEIRLMCFNSCDLATPGSPCPYKEAKIMVIIPNNWVMKDLYWQEMNIP